jgi:hypothetical protein
MGISMNGTEQPKILNAKGEAPPEAPTPQEGPKVAMQIIVTMFEDGSVNASGSIQNKTLAYGLLEVGKDAIRSYVDQHNAPRVAAPQPGLFRRLLGKHSHISAARGR